MPFCLSCRNYFVHKGDLEYHRHNNTCHAIPAKHSCPKCLRVFKGKGGMALHLKVCTIRASGGTWTLPCSILKQQLEVINLLDTLQEIKDDIQDSEPYYSSKNSESESNVVSNAEPKRVDAYYNRLQSEKRETIQKLLKIGNEMKNELIKDEIRRI